MCVTFNIYANLKKEHFVFENGLYPDIFIVILKTDFLAADVQQFHQT
jgi:hypothetical protein